MTVKALLRVQDPKQRKMNVVKGRLLAKYFGVAMRPDDMLYLGLIGTIVTSNGQVRTWILNKSI